MTVQLIHDLQTIVRLMHLAYCNGDDQAYAELAPRYRQLIAEQAQFSLTGGVH
jgi:hypothetical protein